MVQPCSYIDPATRIHGLDGRSVCDYWQWAYSDLLSNTNRPILAEYLVGAALEALSGPRIEWDTTDLTYRGLTIEVKSAAYVQTWEQKRLSAIRFEIAEHQRWNAETRLYEVGTCRHADCYVFCLLAEQDRNRVDPLDSGDSSSSPHRQSISSSATRRPSPSRVSRTVCSAVGFADLNAEIDRVVFDGLSDLLTFTSTSSTGQGRIPVSSLFLSPAASTVRPRITMLRQGPVRRFILSHATC
jgi:hypothetical protein